MARDSSSPRAPVRRTKAPAKRGRASKSAADTLERSDWIAAAKAMLIRVGAAAVKVERVATALNVTRGGFYWRFRDHADLMDALLKDWRDSNSTTMLAALDGPGTPVERMWALMDVWVDEIGYDPAYDIAVRAWGTISKKVARVVRAVDEQRIEAMHKLFVDYGYADMEAFIRARVLYFHQVGYYAMGVKERKSDRHDLLTHYYKVLTGFSEISDGRLSR
jgi:AcrR family transcriptional regulator